MIDAGLWFACLPHGPIARTTGNCRGRRRPGNRLDNLRRGQHQDFGLVVRCVGGGRERLGAGGGGEGCPARDDSGACERAD